MSDIQNVIKHIKANEPESVKRLLEWLRIPSISTDPKYRAETRKAAEWVVEQLAEAGITAELRETGTKEKPGHPIVWAQHEGDAEYDGPHVLFYGHYDVQPPDPLDLWESPPFEPVIKPAMKGDDAPGERIVARGAVDDKGQVSCFLEAMRAWKAAHGSVPMKLSILIEGEEESGSVNLDRFVEENEAELRKADICVISDTGMLKRGHPAITYGVRGLAYTEVILHGPDQDLHSGLWGGRCPNPINELVGVLAQLKDDRGRVTIPGFYDDVIELTKEERQAWAELPVDHVGALKKIGYGPEADRGEAGFTSIEREWARPTADINGIYGGYQGAGAKTVIASKAGAKVSFRLVANQEPDKVVELFRAWLNERTPVGCRWEFIDLHGGFPGTVSTESPYLAAARVALEKASNTDAALIKSGGSIPVVGLLKSALDLDTLLIGFGLDDDRVHSPNEKFELDCYRMGLATHAHLVSEFAAMGASASS
ncbi:MAG: dipeptidase [Phycisphaerales bacterium]